MRKSSVEVTKVKIKNSIKKMRLTAFVRALFPWSSLHSIYFAIKRQLLKFKLRSLAKSNNPILVGPWISEVGFELIYWVPFLSWICNRYQIDPSRIYVVSRGGVSSWYEGVASNYVELYDFISEAEFRDHLLERKDILATQKHIQFSSWDRALLARVAKSLCLEKVLYLHPKEMFHVFQEIWADGASRDAYAMLNHSRLLGNGILGTPNYNLPSKYILCRFYSSKCFRLDGDSKRLIGGLLAKLSKTHEVVLVSPGFNLDDHSDVDIKLDKVTVIDSLPLVENLGIQTALVANADMFITTYGGLSYLGILAGVPTIALHTNGKFLASHLDTAMRASRLLNQGNREAYAEYVVIGADAICQIL